MTAWGISGLALLAFAMAFVLGAVDDDRGPLGLEAQRRGLVELLDASSRALADAEVVVRDAGDGLSSVATAAGDASRFTSELGTTLRALASSLRLSILGSQPFAGPADDMERVAAGATGVAADLDQAASSIRLTAEDTVALADDLADLRAEVNRVRDNLGGVVDVQRWRWIAAAVIAWLAIPALVSVWLGLRWWRPPLVVRPGRRAV